MLGLQIPAALTVLLGAVSALPSSPAPRSSASPQVGYVNVSVATLWTNSGKPRPVDAPALTSPAHIQEWLDAMTVDQFRDLTTNSRTQTQALYGNKVYIQDSQDGWYKIAVPGQPTPSNDLGYPGWVPADQVTTEAFVYGLLQDVRPFVQVTKAVTAPLYSDLLLKHKIMDVSFDTRLPLVIKLGKVIQVAVPGGLAYLAAGDAAVYNKASDIPKPTGEDVVATGMKFIGRPYLWGGTSGYAFDCSGFTHTMYDSHGITIPRDSGPQAYYTGHGTPVDRDDLAAGDLIYYASNLTDPKTIYHVAMYASDGNMLEAYDAGTPVRLTPVRFIADYYGAQRFIH